MPELVNKLGLCAYSLIVVLLKFKVYDKMSLLLNDR